MTVIFFPGTREESLEELSVYDTTTPKVNQSVHAVVRQLSSCQRDPNYSFIVYFIMPLSEQALCSQ